MSEQLFPTFSQKLPWITTDQMIEVDRLMIEVYHIELIQMMENAGRCLAILAKERFLNGQTTGRVTILAGTGGNGGGALVAARRLSSWGFDVSIYVTNVDKMKPIPGHQLSILKNMGLTIHTADDLFQDLNTDLIIDGIIGYSLQGSPHGASLQMMNWANNQAAPILSLDAPSGVDLTTGKIYDATIRATSTMTLALPKIGLADKKVQAYRGELFLADISVPLQLYHEPTLNMEVPFIFRDRDIVKLG